MVTEIQFSERPPRNLDAYEGKIDYKYGIRSGYTYSIMFLCFVLINIIIAIWGRSITNLVIAALVLCIPGLVVAYFFYRNLQNKVKVRKHFLSNAHLAKCVAQKSFGRLNVFNSLPDHFLNINYKIDGKEEVMIIQVNGKARKAVPVGKEFYAFIFPGRKEVLFPHELGVRFVPKPL